MENLHDRRKIYDRAELTEAAVKGDPINQFRDWYWDAEQDPAVSEANAMAISTVEEDGCPRTRMVLLKSFSEGGFVFFTNYESRKGKALKRHPQACLHFFWPPLERQVILKCRVEKAPESISDGYFASRPRGSQLGATVSPQSSTIENRAFLEDQLKRLEAQFENIEIPRPPFWGGYVAKPYEVEFWQGRPDRLHDRLLYTLQSDFNWKIERLAP